MQRINLYQYAIIRLHMTFTIVSMYDTATDRWHVI